MFRGYPEDLICEADGRPPPKIQWLYSPEKVLTVSGNTLIVSEAGLYNCTATNEVDSASHVVEVILKGNQCHALLEITPVHPHVKKIPIQI